MLNLIVQGISLGFAAGAMPGPFTSYLISSALTLGWRRTIMVIFAPLLTDGPIIVLVVFLLGQLPPDAIRLIQVAGGLYLLWIAFQGLRRFRAGPVLDTSPPPAGRTLGRGLLMNWLSPGPYIFWATINGPLLLSGLNRSIWHGLAFLLAFYGTFLGLLAAWVLVFDRLGRLHERFTRAIFLLTLILLALFGLSLLNQGLMAHD